MTDDFLNSLLSTSVTEEAVRKKIHDELRDMAAIFTQKGRGQMAAGLTMASIIALGMKIDTEGQRIFDDLLDNNLQNESRSIPETDAMGREKFWEDIGRPDAQ
jgi:hypothetical protein